MFLPIDLKTTAVLKRIQVLLEGDGISTFMSNACINLVLPLGLFPFKNSKLTLVKLGLQSNQPRLCNFEDCIQVAPILWMPMWAHCPLYSRLSVHKSTFHFQFLQLYHKISIIKVAWYNLIVKNMHSWSHPKSPWAEKKLSYVHWIIRQGKAELQILHPHIHRAF